MIAQVITLDIYSNYIHSSSYAMVRWNTSTSSKFRISKGMRQGSVLSPSLFNIYVDELMSNLTDV